MTELDPIVTDARERLMARARREGLETVGYRVVDSPLGPLWVAVGPRGFLNIHYGAEPSPLELRRIVRAYGPGVLPDAQRVDAVARELDQYWSGKRREFDVTVDLSPLTPFQRKVLAVTARVPYGELITYAKVAHQAGNDKAYRAAAGAIGDNPIPIVVPCHRVVASDGTLGGYAGGLEAKRRLLQLERGAVPPGGWPPAHLSRTLARLAPSSSLGCLFRAGPFVVQVQRPREERAMSKYAFLFIDDGVDYQGDPTPEQQKTYGDIFKWFETNGSKIVDGGAELQPTRTATTIRKARPAR